MSRLPALTREALAPKDQAIWDQISAVRSMQGPSGVLMNVPSLLEQVEALGNYFRFDAALPAADRELVILAAVREIGAGYAWARHEPGAQRAGTRAEAIETVRANGGLDALTPRERLLVEVARALCRDKAVSDELYARASAELGTKQLVEVVTLIGHYTCIGFIIKAFGVQPPKEGPFM
jgi:4-carboxymuconolactone decarboxylase